MQWRYEPGGYLREILTAKVYDVAVRERSGAVGGRWGRAVKWIEGGGRGRKVVAVGGRRWAGAGGEQCRRQEWSAGESREREKEERAWEGREGRRAVSRGSAPVSSSGQQGGRKQRQSLELRCGAAESSRIRGSLTTRGPGWQLGSHLSTLAALL